MAPSKLKALVVAGEDDAVLRLARELQANNWAISTASDEAAALRQIQEARPDVAIVDLTCRDFYDGARPFLEKSKEPPPFPVVALLADQQLADYDFALGIDDFILKDTSPPEAILRLRQLMWRTSRLDKQDVVKCEDLVIDLTKYEVSVAGRLVELTFKEYELLRFLATHPEQVFTREVLLNRIWGYDYYGGARTVDVHIRRLRSKIEDSTHVFIDTIRNVGYRFHPEK